MYQEKSADVSPAACHTASTVAAVSFTARATFIGNASHAKARRIAVNAHHEAVEFRLPLPLPRGSWSTTVDTAQPETKESSRDVGEVLTIEGRSFALLHRKHAAAPPAPSS